MPTIHLVIYFLIYCQLPEGILTGKQEDNAEAFKPVMIGDTTYSMFELPGSETQVVVDERRKLLGHIDFRNFVQDLGHVERFIQLANDGMVGAVTDPEYVKLQLEVQRLGYDITRLCEQSADTVSNIKGKTITVLTDLQPMYHYLIKKESEDTLPYVSDLAGQCAKAAEELYNSFDETAHIVERILEKMMKMKADKEYTARQRETDYRNQVMKAECHYKLYIKAHDRAETSYFENKLKEEKALENFNDEKKVGFILVQFLHKVLGITVIEQSLESKEKQYKHMYERYMKERTDNDEKEEQYLQSFTESIAQLHRCESEVQMAKSSAEALHQAIEGLKLLTDTMMQAAFFWKRMQEHCKALSNSKLKATVAKEMHENSDEQQLKPWKLMSFKKQVVRFNAGWVALDDVCGEFMESIKETKKKLYKYNQETQEEPDTQKACDEKNSECWRR